MGLFLCLLPDNGMNESQRNPLALFSCLHGGRANDRTVYKTHAKYDLFSEGPINKYPRYDVSAVLTDLVKYKCVEEHIDGYCIFGAKTEKERLIKEAEERRQKEQRQKAAHAAACAKIEEQIKAEAAPMVTSITDEYEVKLRNAQREMKKAISVSDKQRDSIQGSISDLRSQKSSLGFFKFKEKKVLQAQIDELEKTLNAISTQQQIYYEYQLLFDRIEKEKKQATDKVMAQIRPKYPMPKYEDFIEK